MDGQTTATLTAAVRSIESLAPAVAALAPDADERRDARRAAERGWFRPEEDDRLRGWFARFLTARAELHATIDEVVPLALDRSGRVDDDTRLRCFLVAYTAAALLVRAGRFLVDDLAATRVVQRKLNEGDPRLRIPRKQYSAVYRALTAPRTAWRLADAMRLADARRSALEAFRDDPVVGPLLVHLDDAEDALRVPVRVYARARLRYRWHAWRRRRASAARQGVFAVMEAFGRAIAEVRNPLHRPRVEAGVCAELERRLAPGDVIVTRHDDAFSNLFLPGYWPHAALHVGPARVKDRLGAALDPARAARWVDPARVLEARKDGVRFRALDDTLGVDAFAVIRPVVTDDLVDRALAQAVAHEGKLYNFDFDFFTADRLVCTEVVYRAYEGIGGIAFTLTRRAGRLTLSAEDLLDMAVDDRGFEAVAVYGAPSCPRELVTGDEARRALAASYRP